MKVKIAEFYDKNCSQLLAESERQSTIGQPEKALKTLLSVPVTSSCATETNSKIKTNYNAYRDKMCDYFLTQAKAANASNNFEKALVFLSKIDPEAGCSSDAESFINEIKKDADENLSEKMKTLREYFSAISNQQNWQIILLKDYLNR